jgi:anti-sigma-K factor RskA
VRIRDKTELQDRLAAEYALGTLRGRARSRFERWLREDMRCARAAAEWQARLAPLAAGIGEARPPARVWRAIEARLNASGARAGAQTVSPGLWDRLGFWRSLGLLASGMAAALLVAVGLIAPQPPPPAPAPAVVRVPAEGMPASYVAVLADPRTQRPVLLVSAARKSDQLWIKTLDPAIHVAERSLELWALPKAGTPKSLGLLATAEKATLKLSAVADQALADAEALAVSLEPRGGSPTGAPTGPVLFSGPCVRYW